MEVDVKTLELDKVCRVCLTVKKDMRPLFGEMVAEMLMDFSRIQVMPRKSCNFEWEKMCGFHIFFPRLQCMSLYA